MKNIFRKSPQEIKLIGSGRTDAGVHASGQVANIILKTNMSPSDLRNAINANIEKNIFITDIIEIDLDFNSRFSAKKRSYVYKIRNDYSPFIENREWIVNSKIDIDLLIKCSEKILGTNDFTLLSKANSEIKNKICTVYSSKWIIYNDRLRYTIKANRFLHHMVRYLVGTMIEVAKKNIRIEDFIGLLNNNCNSYKIFKAPAHGLYLDRVYYE